MQKNSDNTYTILNAGNGYAMDVTSVGTANGTTITAKAVSSSKSQDFYAYNFGGGYHFRAVYSQDGVLDMSESKKTTQLWAYEGTTHQSFTLERVDVAGVLPINNMGNFSAKIKLASGKFLKANGTNVEATSTHEDGPMWKFTYNTNGTYTITEPGGKVMDCTGGKYDNGTNLQVHTSNNTAAQQFYLHKIDGQYVFKANGGSVTGNASVIDLDSASQNAQIYTYSTSTAALAAQRYELVTDKLSGNSPVSNLVDGSYIKIKNDRYGTYLTKNSDNTISVKSANDSLNQIWKVQKNSDSTFSFINAASGTSINMHLAGSTNGSVINVYTSKDIKGQKFYAYLINGSYVFRACYMQDFVMDIGQSIQAPQVWKYNATTSQTYSLEKVDVAGVLPLRDFGNFTTKLKLASGKYLGVNGTNVEANANGVEWEFTYNTNGTYTVKEPGGKVLDCTGGDFIKKTNIQIYNSNNSAAQQFYLYSIDGKFVLKANGGDITAAAMVIDVDSTSQNAQLYTYSTSNASISAQRFSLDMDAAVIGNYKITNVTNWGYDVQVSVSGNEGAVKVGTWTEAGGQDDIKWSQLTPANGLISFHVDVANHGYQSGLYMTEIQATNMTGKTSTGKFSVNVPGISYPADAAYIPLTNANGSQGTAASMLWTKGTFTGQDWGVLVLAQSGDKWVVSAKHDAGVAKSVAVTATSPIVAVHNSLSGYIDYEGVQLGAEVELAGANLSAGAVISNAYIKIPYAFSLREDSTSILDAKYVSVKEKNRTVADIAAEFKCKVTIFSSDDVELADTQMCGTGCVVKYISNTGKVLNSATVVIKGDIDGDGEISTVDLVNAKSVVKSSITLGDVFAEAMDVDSNGSLDTMDYIIIKSLIV